MNIDWSPFILVIAIIFVIVLVSIQFTLNMILNEIRRLRISSESRSTEKDVSRYE